MSTNQPEPAPTTIRVHQAGELAAIASIDTVFLMPAIEAMPTFHPSRRRVVLMTVIAGSILRGELPGPYTNDEAATMAEALLADDQALLRDIDS